MSCLLSAMKPEVIHFQMYGARYSLFVKQQLEVNHRFMQGPEATEL